MKDHMSSIRVKVVGTSLLGACIALASLGVLSQPSSDTPVSISEVQAFIEQKVGEGFPIDEVISSGLELGYRPELLAAVLMNLSLEPATIAVALANEGVPRVEAAKAVITVAGAPLAPPVLEALLISAPPEEQQALTQQVTEFVTTVTQTTQATQEAPTQDVATQTPESESSTTTEQTAATDTTATETTAPTETAATTEALATTADTSNTSPTTVTETQQPAEPPPVVVVVVTPPTPPIQGGGGGATVN